MTLVNLTNPYSACTIGGPGTVYVNAEVEPSVDVNPTNPLNIVGAWQQDRWSNGGAHGLVAGYSFDGGTNWLESILPFTNCSGGLPYERASDPWVSFGPDGRVYISAIVFNEKNNKNAIAVVASTDGGKTWTNLSTLIQDKGGRFNDKASITADPVKSGVAYAVWQRSGPAMFSKTMDGGATWSRPKAIVSSTTNGNLIVVDRKKGTLYDFFNYEVNGNNVAFVKSIDAGTTWTQPQIISPMNIVTVTDPTTGSTIRTGGLHPEVDIDPNTGKLYVVWQDSRFSNGQYSEIAISYSSDQGDTWSPPIRVNKPFGKAAFTPMVKVNSAGVVGVTYYDFRNDTSDPSTLWTNYWFTTSADGVTFNTEICLAGPFDMLTAPYANGYMVGDYEGLASNGTNFFSLYVLTNSGSTTNRTDVFFTKI